VKKKYIIWISLIVVVLAIGGYYYYSKSKTNVILWKTTPVEKGNIRVAATATGSINALTTVQVGTQVSGTIAKLFADFNSVVKKDQIIAMLDTTFLAAAKDDAQAAVEKANIQLKQSKIEFNRQQQLFKQGAIAQADFDLANTNYESAKSTLRSAEAQRNRAKINLQYATIRAPISGVVISRSVDVGQTVVASFNTPTLFTIANDLTKMQVYANVDEADIGQIKVGQEATFTVDAYPDLLFTGEIKQIRLQPNVIQNVVNYTVIIDVANPDLKLLPGLTANINVKVLEHKNILKIPVNALHFIPPPEYTGMETLPDTLKRNLKKNQIKTPSTGSMTYIWKKTGEDISPQKVMIGLIEGGYAEVSGNIKEGDEIVTGVIKDGKGSSTKNPFMPSFSPRTKKIKV
jgi:HlyD family secretion protein